MSDKELADTLKKAAASQEENLALKVLLLIAAERLEQYAELEKDGITFSFDRG